MIKSMMSKKTLHSGYIRLSWFCMGYPVVRKVIQNNHSPRLKISPNSKVIKMRSQFVIVGLLAIAGFSAVALAVPLLQSEGKDYFLYETEGGEVIHAHLKEENPVPEGAIERDVIFWHYTPGQEEGRKVIANCIDDCFSGFIPDAPLVIVAHGFSSSHTGGFGERIREGFAKRGEPYNLLFVNWSKRSAAPWYLTAVKNVAVVGEYTAALIDHLVERKLASLDKTFHIGHSLGAHIANAISAHLKEGKLKEIFALDPASPLFEGRSDSERLDPSDADFVNVIHTSIGFLGFEEPRGHIDFYPNGGSGQPGCSELIGSCSHSRSYDYLGESIGSPSAFPSCKCESWVEYVLAKCPCEEKVVMGWNTPQTAQGKYFLTTNAESPFGQYQW